MATENNWLKTNIKDRLTDPSVKVVSYFDNIPYSILSFKEASQNVVEKIVSKYENIFIPFSGGMDSEYVFNCFLRHKFTPIIVDTPCNKEESFYAFKRCEEVNLKPIVIKKTEKELIETYYNEIYKKLNGVGYNSAAAFIAAKYADENNGIAVIAEHGYDGTNEWDFYNDVLIHEENSVYFFMYDPEIFYAMQKEYNGEDHQIFKHKLYGVELRPKIKYKYSEAGDYIIKSLMSKIWLRKING